MNIGTKIKTVRELKNISREQMSDQLEMSINTYKKIEYGERSPTYDEIEKISELCEINPSFFYEQAGNTFIQNGSNFNGMIESGKIVMADKEFMSEVMGILKEIPGVLNEVSEKLKDK